MNKLIVFKRTWIKREIAAEYHDLTEMPGIWIMKVISDSIERAAYDPEESTMFIQFKGGGAKKTWYEYEGVPLKLFVQFSEAESKGVFFKQKIKDKFTANKLTF